MNDSDKTLRIAPPLRIERAGFFVLTMLGLFLLAEAVGAFQALGRHETPATDTITVTGNGQASMAPDVAHISFAVEHTAATVKEAQDQTTTQANAAIAYAREQGIEEKDIRTTYYNISPQYSSVRPCSPGAYCPDYVDYTQKVIGYQVSQSIQLTIRDLDKTGTVLGGLGNLQVQNISGPDLALDDPTAGNNAARADAIVKAKEHAQTLAKQLGVRLGRIVSFSESSGGGMYYSKGYATAADSAGMPAPAPEIPTGENQYSAYVTIVYEIR